MKRFLKFILYIFILLAIFIIVFYFWASSPNLSKDKYALIKTNDFPAKTLNDSTFSILTYNIGYLSGMTNNLPVKKEQKLYDENLNLVKGQIKKLNPDILAFQEIDYAAERSFNVNQQDKIASLGYQYVAQTVNWDKKYLPFPEFPVSMHYGRLISGQSVLSKYPITDQERIELKRNPTNPFYYDRFYIDRLAQVVKLMIGKQEVYLINVHLEAYHKKTRIKQTQKVIEIYQKYSQNYPTLLVGDFNSDEHFKNASIRMLLDLPGTGNAVYQKGNSKTYSSGKPEERLDYIFYNLKFLKFTGGKVLPEFRQASDHFPLIATFKFK